MTEASVPTDRTLARRAAVTSSATYFLWCAGLGVYVPFFPLWLAGRGFDPETIGVLLAVPMVVRIIATAPITRLADGWLGPRRTLLIVVAGAAASYAGLVFVWGFWPVAAMLAVLSVFVAAAVPLLDVIALRGVAVHGHDYGRIRVFGSFAWLIANFMGGVFLTALPSEAIPPLLALLAVSAFLAGLTMPADHRDRARAPEAAERGTAMPRLAFIAFTVAVSLMQGAHAFLFGFSSLMWRSTGYSEAAIGALWSVSTVFEMLLFVAGGGLAARLGPWWLITIGGVAGIIRWGAMATAPSDALALIMLQSAHVFTYGCVHLGTMNWLARFPERRGALQGIVAAAIGGAWALGTVMSGWLYETVGSLGFVIMALGSAGGLAALALAWRAERAGR